MKGKNKISNLLTLEEQADYYRMKAKLYRADLYEDLSGVEYKRLYQKASQLLLTAVERELKKRGIS